MQPLAELNRPFNDPTSVLTLSQLRLPYSPSPAERDDLLATIASISSQIALYKIHMTRFPETSSFLETEKHNAEEAKRRKESLLAPVRRLPIELLGEIFRIYCSDEVEKVKTTTYFSYTIITPVLTLGRVCVYWRTVTLTNPYLWSNIHIRRGTMSKGALELLGTSLRLSKETALVIDACFDTLDERFRNAKKGLEMLFECTDRWKEARLETSWRSWQLMTNAQNLKGSNFSQLESLEFIIHDFEMSSGCRQLGDSISSAFSSAKNLRRLVMDQNPAIFPHFPYSLLTSLSLAHFFPQYIWIIDQAQCPNLRDLEISMTRYQYWEDFSIVNLPMTTSRSLKYLRIKDANSQFLRFLCLPKLETLEISYRHRYIPSPEPQVPFVEMLERSRPPLRKLILGMGFYSPGDSIGGEETLRMFPELTHLRMPMYSDTNSSYEEFVRRFIVGSPETTLLPKLTSLSLYMGKMIDAPLLEAICDMLESRMGLNLPEGFSFKISAERGWHHDAVAQIGRFKALALARANENTGFCLEWWDSNESISWTFSKMTRTWRTFQVSWGYC